MPARKYACRAQYILDLQQLQRVALTMQPDSWVVGPSQSRHRRRPQVKALRFGRRPAKAVPKLAWGSNEVRTHEAPGIKPVTI